MTRAERLFCIIAAASLHLACDRVAEAPFELEARFPVSRQQLRQAVVQRFPEVLQTSDTVWPSGQPERSFTVTLDTGATVETPADLGALRLDPLHIARIEVSVTDLPGEGVDLRAGPLDTGGTDDPRLVTVARVAVPARPGLASWLQWTVDGPSIVERALSGTLEGAEGARGVVFSARVSIPIRLVPGAPLPGADLPEDGAPGSATLSEDALILHVPLGNAP